MNREQAKGCAIWFAELYPAVTPAQAAALRDQLEPFDDEAFRKVAKQAIGTHSFPNDAITWILGELRRQSRAAVTPAQLTAEQARERRELEHALTTREGIDDQLIDPLTDGEFKQLAEAVIAGGLVDPVALTMVRSRPLRKSRIIRGLVAERLRETKNPSIGQSPPGASGSRSL